MSEPSKPARKPLPKIDDYPHRVTDIIRFGDLDAQGHVNNAVFATYFESGRVTMFRGPDLGIGVSSATFVLVRQEIDFLREMRWPGQVVIATGISDFGRSSFVARQALFAGDECTAIGRATLVMMDTATRRATPLTDAAKTRLTPWLYRENPDA